MPVFAHGEHDRFKFVYFADSACEHGWQVQLGQKATLSKGASEAGTVPAGRTSSPYVRHTVTAQSAMLSLAEINANMRTRAAQPGVSRPVKLKF